MRRKFILVVLAAVALVAFLLAVQRLPSRVGRLDFRAYWSTSYLLSKGLDYTDEASLHEVETSLTGWTQDYTLKLWNLPWVVVWFLPLAFLDFHLARPVWLTINLLLLFVSIVAYWRAYATNATTQKWFWLALLLAIFFPATLLLLLFGQVGLLVLAGIVGFIVLYRKSHDFEAGIFLTLTTVKPHLVYLVLPLLLLVVVKSRRWRVLIGFTSFLLVSLAVGLLLRPSLISDYFDQTTQGNLLAWQSPTVTAYLHARTGLVYTRLIGILLLPIVIFWWARFGQEIEIGDLVNIALLMSIITTPFGWSYDFVLLLLPLVRLALWVLDGALGRQRAVLMALVMVSLYVVIYRQRIAAQNELDFFWIPLVVAGLYLWVRSQAQRGTGLPKALT